MIPDDLVAVLDKVDRWAKGERGPELRLTPKDREVLQGINGLVETYRDGACLVKRRLTVEGAKILMLGQQCREREREDARIRMSMETGNCAHCDTEMELESTHERDSTNDFYYCPICFWQYPMIDRYRLEMEKL